MKRNKLYKATGNSYIRRVKPGNIETSNAATEEMGCCMSLKHYSLKENKDVIQSVILQEHLKYEHMTKPEYIIKVLNFIKDMGFDIEWEQEDFCNFSKTLKQRSSGMFKQAFVVTINAHKYTSGDMTLATHALIRALWKDTMSGLWDDVLMLRDLPELKHLDNWEIWQLAELKKDYEYYWGVLKTHKDQGVIHYIIPQSRMIERLGNKFLNGINAKVSLYENISKEDMRKIRNLYTKGKYLELYNLRKIPDNIFSHCLCVNDENKEDKLTQGKLYDVNGYPKNKKLIIVNDDTSTNRRFIKTRFKFI